MEPMDQAAGRDRPGRIAVATVPKRADTSASDSSAEPPASQRDYATRIEAMRLLGVRQQTLYAYVSRGWVRSIAQPGQKEKLYLRDDLARLSMRAQARAGHGAVAASAMNWGEPIFPSSITEITAQGPAYRGQLAEQLVSRDVDFESVAELLWTGEMATKATRWPVRRPLVEMDGLRHLLESLPASGNVLETFASVVLVLGSRRGSIVERVSRGRMLPAAREVIQTLVSCCGFLGQDRRFVPQRSGESMVSLLMRALCLEPTKENQTALQAILILLADHELSPGTLSARVVASAGGTLHSCLASALCATSGLEVGRIYDRVEDLLARASTTSAMVARALLLVKQGQQVPGFDHPVYPNGDPRATQLLPIARARENRSPQARAVDRFIDRMQSELGMLPRQELAVVVLSRTMGLSRQLPPVLFALSRMAGWVAHVQEQRAAGTLLRPRAKYVEAQPQSDLGDPASS